MKPQLHPACAAFPPLPEAELRALADDIKANGHLEPITVMPDGAILDGRSLWDACEIAGIEPRTVVYQGHDPIRFVISKNERRRHLSITERAFIAEELATLAHGGDRIYSKGLQRPLPNFTRVDAAAALGISKSTLGEARLLKQQAAPHILDMVRRQEIGIHPAARAVSGTPKTEQETWTTPVAVNAVVRQRRAEREGKRLPSKFKAKPERIDIPYTTVKFPTSEETGFPVDGTMHEQDAHREKYGRTPLHPQAVKHMLDHEGSLSVFLAAIISVANERHPDAEQFFASIDAMLAWKPQPERGKGFEVNYASKARKHLLTLDKVLDKAINRLADLRARLKTRTADKGDNAREEAPETYVTPMHPDPSGVG